MFDFASLNGLVRDRPLAAKASRKEENPNTMTPYLQTAQIQAQAIPSVTIGGNLTSQGNSMNGQQANFVNSLQPGTSYDTAGLGYQPFATQTMQTPATVMPLGVFPDGSTFVSFNGVNYRSYWNGVNLVMEPLSATPLPASPQTHTTIFAQGPYTDPHLAFVNQAVPSVPTSIPLASATNESRAFCNKSNAASHDQTASSEEGMRTQLDHLDKHLALYHYDVSPEERAVFIAQRRHLIEELDKIRVRKDRTMNTMPIIRPATRVQIKNESTPAVGGPDTNPKMALRKDGLSTKCLSPAAIPFVPRNMQNNRSVSLGSQLVKDQIKERRQQKSSEPRAAQKALLNIMDIANTAISRKDKALHGDQPKNRAVSNSEESTSGFLDSRDPAMRVIEYDDIEYAGRYLYNWTLETKTYCTTVAEFQEAIRRVREQARLYGCAGGSSKDPAYDAEQDLWWAICDRDPIPLPTKVPDHVSNPRPWNWNDSAFNYRRKGAPWPGPACEQARNSPRLSGWDPALTESMKDTMDVSRSYYALNGQLPSVPFRDFAYDQHGRKVKIEPEATDSAINYEAPTSTEKASISPKYTQGETPQSAAAANFNALRDMTTSDINGRHVVPVRTSRVKASRKKNLTEADAIRPKNSMSEHEFHKSNITPDPYNSRSPIGFSSPTANAYRETDAKPKKIANRPHQPYVEDCPDTPTARRLRADSKGSPTPGKERARPFEYCMSGDPNDHHVKAATPSQSPSRNQSEAYVSHNKPLDVDDPWYGAPTEPVTLEYLARLKARHPGDPDVLKIMEAQANHRSEYDLRLPEESSYGKVDASPDLAPPRPPNECLDGWSSWDLSVQTRSQWGPEEDGQSFESQDPWGSAKHDPMAPTQEVLKTVKVNIPSAPYARLPGVGDHDIETSLGGFHNRNSLVDDEAKSGNDPRHVPSISVEQNNGYLHLPRPTIPDSLHFLRKMLKSPPYSLSQAQIASEQISAALKKSRSKFSDAKAINTTRQGNKENKTTDAKPSSREVRSSSMSSFKSHPNVSVSKAQSLSSSYMYQAQNSTTRFNGAGKTDIAVTHPNQSNQLPLSLVRVNLPSHGTYASRQAILATSTQGDYGNGSGFKTSANHYIPVNFGLDGGADSPIPHQDGAANSNQHTNPNFDYKGVTTADYEINRGNPENQWHRGEVKDFFERLAAEEQKEIKAHQQQRAENKRTA